MANVPATFPVMPVNGYMISGMLTRGKTVKTRALCAQVIGSAGRRRGLSPAMKAELLKTWDFTLTASACHRPRI